MYLCTRKYKLIINMSKTTMGNKLPRKLEQKMHTVGEQIRLARLRRDLSVAQVAERATCSPLTVSRIEKGAPTVAIGIYLRVLYALQLDDDILLLARRSSESHQARLNGRVATDVDYVNVPLKNNKV